MEERTAKSASGSVPQAVRPPTSWNSTWLPGATSGDPMRPTAMERPVVRAELISHSIDGYAPTDEYVRTFWISVLGPGAVADLLRLAAAAHSGRPLKRPNNLGVLIREGLAQPIADGTIKVHQRVPPLNAKQVRRLPPGLRREHQRQRPTDAPRSPSLAR